jgi:hypothetical protein
MKPRLMGRLAGIPSQPDRLAVIESLEFSEFLGVLFDQVGELIQQAPSLDSRGIPAPSGLERLAGRRDCHVDVLRRG